VKKAHLAAAVVAITALISYKATADIYNIVNLTESLPYGADLPSLNDHGQVAYRVNITGRGHIYLDDIDYSTPPPNALDTSPSLNNNGNVAWARNDNQGNLDFMLDGVNLTEDTDDHIGFPVINNNGNLAWGQHTNEWDVFLDGINLTADLPGNAQQFSLNDHGQIAWSQRVPDGGFYYIYLDGAIISGGNGEIAFEPSLNNQGQVAWVQQTGPDEYDIILDGENITQGISGQCRNPSLNDFGQVAWWCIDGANTDIYLDGINITADYSSAAYVPSLNNNGQIAWYMGGDIYLATTIISPTVAVQISGGTPQECTGVGGNQISLDAAITIDNSDALDTVSWTLDGNPVASGESVSVFIPLGMHTVEATVTTILGQSATDSATIVVDDTIAPVITAGFTDAKTGTEITTISSRDKVVPFYSIADDCDASPTVITATAGVSADNVDTLSAKTDKKEPIVNVSIKGTTEIVELAVTAQDASGNMSSSKAVLTIVP